MCCVIVDELWYYFDVNVVGVLNGMRIFVDYVCGCDGGGVLINILLGVVCNVYEGWGVYCVGKVVVDCFIEVVVFEEVESGVKVYVFVLGVVDMDM